MSAEPGKLGLSPALTWCHPAGSCASPHLLPRWWSLLRGGRALLSPHPRTRFSSKFPRGTDGGPESHGAKLLQTAGPLCLLPSQPAPVQVLSSGGRAPCTPHPRPESGGSPPQPGSSASAVRASPAQPHTFRAREEPALHPSLYFLFLSHTVSCDNSQMEAEALCDHFSWAVGTGPFLPGSILGSF